MCQCFFGDLVDKLVAAPPAPYSRTRLQNYVYQGVMLEGCPQRTRLLRNGPADSVSNGAARLIEKNRSVIRVYGFTDRLRSPAVLMNGLSLDCPLPCHTNHVYAVSGGLREDLKNNHARNTARRS